MNVQLHANPVSVRKSQEFKGWISWLRLPNPQGPGLSWGQIVRSGNKLSKILGDANPEQVLQDIARGPRVNVRVYDAVREIWEHYQEKAANGEYGIVAKEEAQAREPGREKKVYSSSSTIADDEYRKRLLRTLAKERRPLTSSELIRSTKGTHQALRAALDQLVRRNVVVPVRGKWPPVQGQPTELVLAEGVEVEMAPDPGPEEKQTKTSESKKVEVARSDEPGGDGPSLPRVRYYLAKAVAELESLAENPPKNVPASIQELACEQFLASADDVGSIIYQLREG